MATFNKFNSFTLAMGSKVHNLAADQLQIALCATANAPVAGNSQLSNLTEIAYTNLSSRVVTTTSFTQASGVAKLICADLTLTASGVVAGFQYIVLYNNTATNKELIGWWDFGSSNVMGNTDTFLIDLDQTNGVFTNT